MINKRYVRGKWWSLLASPRQTGTLEARRRSKPETNSPMFLTKRSNVRYALDQLDLLIFTTMKALVARDCDITLNGLMKEIEHYTGVTTQRRRDARRELQRVTQRPNEKINDYYHPINSVWQKADTPEKDRVDQFLTTMSPTLRELLDDARTAESITREVQQKTASFHHRRPPGCLLMFDRDCGGDSSRII